MRPRLHFLSLPISFLFFLLFFGGASGKNPAVSPYSFAFSAFSFFVCLVFRTEKGKFCSTVYFSHCCF